MVINSIAYEISRNARKLTWTPTLIKNKINKKKTLNYVPTKIYYILSCYDFKAKKYRNNKTREDMSFCTCVLKRDKFILKLL
jgi:hypothetical protein